MSRCFLIWVVAAFAFGGGCVSTGFYRNATGPDVATLTGFLESQQLGKWASASVVSVDGQDILRPKFLHASKAVVQLTPGKHAVTCEYEFQRRLTNKFQTARATVMADFLPGRRYVIDGAVAGDAVKIWIKDRDTGEKVSDVVKSGLTRSVN